jgi:hypothetical protein
MDADRTGLSLQAGLQAAGMSYRELWLNQIAVGGSATEFEVEAYVTGALKPDPHQHNVLAQAINEHFIDAGLDHPVAYVDEPSWE